MAEQLVAKFSNLPIKWHKTQDRMSEASCVLSEWMTNEDNPLQYLAKCKHELLQKVLVGTERSNSEKYCLNTMGSSKSISLLQTSSMSSKFNVPMSVLVPFLKLGLVSGFCSLNLSLFQDYHQENSWFLKMKSVKDSIKFWNDSKLEDNVVIILHKRAFTSLKVLIGHNSETLCPLFVEEFGKNGRKNVGNIHCLTCFMDTHLDETQNFILRNSWVTSDLYRTLYKTRDSGEIKYKIQLTDKQLFSIWITSYLVFFFSHVKPGKVSQWPVCLATHKIAFLCRSPGHSLFTVFIFVSKAMMWPHCSVIVFTLESQEQLALRGELHHLVSGSASPYLSNWWKCRSLARSVSVDDSLQQSRGCLKLF